MLINDDCLNILCKYSDNCFDLAVVDPPYGIGQDWKKNSKGQHYKNDIDYANDKVPDEKYFQELFRISKNQIIWGGNYFVDCLPVTNSWIVWDKVRNVEKTFMSEAEMAWTSYKTPMRIFYHQWDGAKKGTETGKKTIHPHQKPIALYQWIYEKYTKPGMKVIDTHLGSGSSAIAAYYNNLDFTGIEKSKSIFENAKKRIKEETSQMLLFA